jgi:hypothetical protein
MQLKGGKVQNVKRTHGSEGRPNGAEMGLGWLAQAGWPGPFPRWFDPPFLEREDNATLSTWRRHHSRRESRSPEKPSEAVHRLESKKRREIIRKKDRSTRMKQPQVEEDVEALSRHPQRRRKTPMEASP